MSSARCTLSMRVFVLVTCLCLPCNCEFNSLESKKVLYDVTLDAKPVQIDKVAEFLNAPPTTSPKKSTLQTRNDVNLPAELQSKTVRSDDDDAATVSKEDLRRPDDQGETETLESRDREMEVDDKQNVGTNVDSTTTVTTTSDVVDKEQETTEEKKTDERVKSTEVHQSLEPDEIPNPTESLILASELGQQFVCRLPSLSTILPELDEQSMSTQTALQLLEIENVTDVLSETFVLSPCMRTTQGWWTYEYCFGENKELIQYRLEGDEKVGDTIVLGTSDGYGRPKDLVISKTQTAYFVQTFTQGTKCDLNGKLRRAEVRFYCDPDILETDGFIQAVDEPETCRYVITINVGSLCKLRAYRRMDRPETPHAINCRPLLNNEEMTRYELSEKRKLEAVEKQKALNEKESLKKQLLDKHSNLPDKMLKDLEQQFSSLNLDQALAGAGGAQVVKFDTGWQFMGMNDDGEAVNLGENPFGADITNLLKQMGVTTAADADDLAAAQADAADGGFEDVPADQLPVDKINVAPTKVPETTTDSREKDDKKLKVDKKLPPPPGVDDLGLADAKRLAETKKIIDLDEFIMNPNYRPAGFDRKKKLPTFTAERLTAAQEYVVRETLVKIQSLHTGFQQTQAEKQRKLQSLSPVISAISNAKGRVDLALNLIESELDIQNDFEILGIFHTFIWMKFEVEAETIVNELAEHIRKLPLSDHESEIDRESTIDDAKTMLQTYVAKELRAVRTRQERRATRDRRIFHLDFPDVPLADHIDGRPVLWRSDLIVNGKWTKEMQKQISYFPEDTYDLDTMALMLMQKKYHKDVLNDYDSEQDMMDLRDTFADHIAEDVGNMDYYFEEESDPEQLEVWLNVGNRYLMNELDKKTNETEARLLHYALKDMFDKMKFTQTAEKVEQSLLESHPSWSRADTFKHRHLALQWLKRRRDNLRKIVRKLEVQLMGGRISVREPDGTVTSIPTKPRFADVNRVKLQKKPLDDLPHADVQQLKKGLNVDLKDMEGLSKSPEMKEQFDKTVKELEQQLTEQLKEAGFDTEQPIQVKVLTTGWLEGDKMKELSASELQKFSKMIVKLLSGDATAEKREENKHSDMNDAYTFKVPNNIDVVGQLDNQATTTTQSSHNPDETRTSVESDETGTEEGSSEE